MGELIVPADELAGDWQEALKQISRRMREAATRSGYERASELPALAAFVGDDWTQNTDERFEAGLRWLVAGMAMDLQSGA